MKKRIFCAWMATLLCLLLFCPLLSVPASAEAPALPNTSAANAALFYHIESGTTLLSQNTDVQLPAGSTVKIMSGLLFCELYKNNLSDQILITDDMVRGISGHKLGLEEGDILSIEDLLYAALCAGYNDAYHVLAYLSEQSIEKFVMKMNARATEMGLRHTSFQDPSGVKDASSTSADDLLKTALAAYQNPLYMQICAAKSHYIAAINKTIKNRNEMISGNDGYIHYNDKCNGISAGSTDLGGDCIVASATNGKDSYLCILLNCGESAVNDQKNNKAYLLANTLINWVYDTYTYMEVLSPETVICTIPVTVSDITNEVNVIAKDSLFCYVPSTVEIGKEITYSIRLTHTSLEAPVTEGTFVGYVAVLYGDQMLGTVPLYTAGAAERSGFISRLMSIQLLTKNRTFVAGASFFLVALIAWIVAEVLLSRQRHRRWNKYFSNKIDTTKRHTKQK